MLTLVVFQKVVALVARDQFSQDKPEVTIRVKYAAIIQRAFRVGFPFNTKGG